MAEEPAPDASLVATAFHEAGHAVMALIVGRSVHKVTIAPGQMHAGRGLRLGECRMEHGRSKAAKDWIEDEVLILLAGMAAEARFTGEYCRRGASQDLRNVHRLLEHRAGSERQLDRLVRRLLDKTEHLLNDEAHYQAIERIARRLLQDTTLSGRAVKHLFHHSG